MHDVILACAHCQDVGFCDRKSVMNDAGVRHVQQLPDTRSRGGNWVQTERAAHEAWGALIAKAPKAAQLMHVLVARVGPHNAVVVSQNTLMALTKTSRRTVQRALAVLVEDRWIEVRQVGQNGTVNAYVINDRVAWTGKRDGIRYSLFSASVVVSDEEQPDRDEIGHQEPLRRVPSIGRGEQQLPTGPGLPPPSEPSFPGMEHDLPATHDPRHDGGEHGG
ncbi:MAG: hypothetical protein ACU0CI_13525 [Shimia sp.]